MVEVYSDVGGERHCVADEKKRSTIVADTRMAWMWKVSDVFVPNKLKVKKKKKTEMKKNIKTARYRGFLRACLHFRRCEITTKAVMLRGSNGDFSLLACLLLALNV